MGRGETPTVDPASQLDLISKDQYNCAKEQLEIMSKMEAGLIKGIGKRQA